MTQALRRNELLVVAVAGRVVSDVVLAVATARRGRDAVRPAEQGGRVDGVVEPAREGLRPLTLTVVERWSDCSTPAGSLKKSFWPFSGIWEQRAHPDRVRLRNPPHRCSTRAGGGRRGVDRLGVRQVLEEVRPRGRRDRHLRPIPRP